MIEPKDTSLLMLLSLRYCMGRQTYMPKMIRDMERAHNLLNEHDRAIAIKNIESDVGLMHPPGKNLADDHDHAEWREFAEYLRSRT